MESRWIIYRTRVNKALAVAEAKYPDIWASSGADVDKAMDEFDDYSAKYVRGENDGASLGYFFNRWVEAKRKAKGKQPKLIT